MRKLIYLLFISFLLSSCSKSIDDFPKSNLRTIAQFSFLPHHNYESNIVIEHVGEINQASKQIVVIVPGDADLRNLRPQIKLSPWTSIEPANLENVDFSNGEVEFTARAQSGKTAVYSVKLEPTYVYKKAELFSVTLPDVLNELAEPYMGKYLTFTNGSSTTISTPPTTVLNAQRVLIELSPASHRAKVRVCDDGSGTNFRSFINSSVVNLTQKIIFEVTSEDTKSSIKYNLLVNHQTNE